MVPASVRRWSAVVTGVPRSGTSLVMQMLAAGGMPVLTDGARPPDAHNPRGYLELERARRIARDRGWLRHAEGHAFKLVHALVRQLPPEGAYRVLLLRRRLDEVVRSQRAMLEARDAPAGPGLDALPDTRWIEIFEAQLSELERWIRARPGWRLLRVDYNALLRDPRASAEEMSRFLGGDLDVTAMQRCVDPCLYRQRSAR